MVQPVGEVSSQPDGYLYSLEIPPPPQQVTFFTRGRDVLASFGIRRSVVRMHRYPWTPPPEGACLPKNRVVSSNSVSESSEL